MYPRLCPWESAKRNKVINQPKTPRNPKVHSTFSRRVLLKNVPNRSAREVSCEAGAANVIQSTNFMAVCQNSAVQKRTGPGRPQSDHERGSALRKVASFRCLSYSLYYSLLETRSRCFVCFQCIFFCFTCACVIIFCDVVL